MSKSELTEFSITSREMRALEQNAEYLGVSRLQLMENAGHTVALEVASRFKPESSVAVFCGLGGNGGDGFVAARHLCAMGYNVMVFLAGKAKDIADKAALQNWIALQALRDSIAIQEVYDSSLITKTDAQVAIDALLGIGAKGLLKPPILQLVKRINMMKAFRVAIDVPTGVNADTGEVEGEAVKADVTITFHRLKHGLKKAREFTGELVVKDIGLPRSFERIAGPGDVSIVVKTRQPHAHKGDFGKLLVIGGSETFTGAPQLVALAALRTGVDLAYVAAPEKTAQTIASTSPDLITLKLKGSHLNPDNVAELKEYVEKSTAVAVGSGLGLHRETWKAVKLVVDVVEKAGKPLLLDADGLKAFAEFKKPLKVPLVLTPHSGEYAILAGVKPPEDLQKRISEVQKTASKLKATVLLKGAVDVISNGSRSKLNFTGNAGMTVGGTGDVLSGVVGAFLAQDADPFEASVAGAFVNGAAGDFVFEEKGYHMVATDLIDWLPRVLDDPMSRLKVRKAGAATG
ncbi:MAG: NAD(P)H-hydrate dehydratase [Candidatus Bathyarchaeota archaeon]|nr:NAD(P)H-hydrate dehydratase [Candidatus Bathyarchaeota archaeon]